MTAISLRRTGYLPKTRTRARAHTVPKVHGNEIPNAGFGFCPVLANLAWDTLAHKDAATLTPATRRLLAVAARGEQLNVDATRTVAVIVGERQQRTNDELEPAA